MIIVHPKGRVKENPGLVAARFNCTDVFFLTETAGEDPELTLYILEIDSSLVKEYRITEKIAQGIYFGDPVNPTKNFATMSLFRDSQARRIMQIMDRSKNVYFYDVELDRVLVKIKEGGIVKHRMMNSPFDEFPMHDKLILGYGHGVHLDFDNARKRGEMIELDPEDDVD